jgi:hypothetical protein
MESPDQHRQRAARARRVMDRVVGLRRAPTVPAPAPDEPPATDVEALRDRIAHLERALEGLQDQVYREGQRHDGQIAELRVRLEPANVARSLDADARRRGL